MFSSVIATAGRQVGADSEGRRIWGGPGQDMDGTGEPFNI